LINKILFPQNNKVAFYNPKPYQKSSSFSLLTTPTLLQPHPDLHPQSDRHRHRQYHPHLHNHHFHKAENHLYPEFH